MYFDKKSSFTFDGQKYSGYQGDTLASALIRNGIFFVGRSFKYHRPRGIISSGSEEQSGNRMAARGHSGESGGHRTDGPVVDPW